MVYVEKGVIVYNDMFFLVFSITDNAYDHHESPENTWMIYTY